MYKQLLLIVTLLITAALGAQDAGKPSSPSTIQGCLQYTNGHYRLTEDNGTIHQLQSQANKLAKHVGHEVEITGTPAVRSVDTYHPGCRFERKRGTGFSSDQRDTCSRHVQGTWQLTAANRTRWDTPDRVTRTTSRDGSVRLRTQSRVVAEFLYLVGGD